MADERPLHVLVAEAIGIKVVSQAGEWRRVVTETDQAITTMSLPRYDTSWCATGPIIERYGFALEQTSIGWRAGWQNGGYDLIGAEWWFHRASGSTPLLAACHLLLRLAEAGKLDVFIDDGLDGPEAWTRETDDLPLHRSPRS